MRLVRFNGERYVPFSDVIESNQARPLSQEPSAQTASPIPPAITPSSAAVAHPAAAARNLPATGGLSRNPDVI
jgi:hypothetical protein